MQIQHYSVKIEDHTRIEVGQFVFPHNESNEVNGFVYKVKGVVAEFVLFEPREQPSTLLVFEHHGLLHDTELQTMFSDTMSRADPVLRHAWSKLTG